MRETIAMTLGLNETPERVAAAAFVIVLVGCCSAVYADTPRKEVKLGPWAEGVKVGPGMSAAGRRLAGSRFAAQNLVNASFEGCDLFHVTFHACDLSGASFRNARLTDARFLDCVIDGADFTDAIINGVNLEGTYTFSERQLKSTMSYKLKDLRNCRIPSDDGGQYDLRDADLRGAGLNDLRQADIRNARIDDAHFDLFYVAPNQLYSTWNFQHKSLVNARMTLHRGGSFDFSGMYFYNVQFLYHNPEVKFTDASIGRCSFRLGALTQQRLRETRDYRQGILQSVRMYDVDFSAFDFSRINMTGCIFSNCDFKDALFDNAIISRVRFGYQCRGLTVEQIKSTWNFRHARMEGIELPKEVADALEAEGSKRDEACEETDGR